jgi:hypothetical protein
MPLQKRKSSGAGKIRAESYALPSTPPAAVFSFLKDTRGAIVWTAADLARTLHVSAQEAAQVLAVLEIQGYAQRSKSAGEWSTTAAGEVVSGSKFPRYSRESVEQALSTLKDRIAAVNRNNHADFKIRQAVAYGDFLTERPQVQAADVGIELTMRVKPASRGANQRSEREQSFLKELRRKSPLLHLHPYEKWMSARTHQTLV